MPHTIFYSWQSDLPNPTNRNFIQNSLESAIKDLKSDGSLTVDPVLDRDTTGVPGSPDIGQTIFYKIDQAAAFVCDVSIINGGSNRRRVPNPNVLIELGYALKSLGPDRVIMVMNTAFGRPESLPFDLRQKRVITYSLSEGDEAKSEAKQGLRGSFTQSLKSILSQYEKSNLPITAPEIPLTDRVIEAIKTQRPDQARIVTGFMKWLSQEFTNIDSQKFTGEPDDQLVEKISKSLTLVEHYDKVADTVAAMNAEEAGRSLVRGFEYILTFYYLPKGFSGTHRATDFDFYKFVGQEMFTILFAYLLKDDRASLISALLEQAIYVSNGPSGQTSLNYKHVSQYIHLLDEIRSHRLVVNNQRRISHHADILKERHESGLLAKNLNWDEFCAADLFLFLYSFAHQESEFDYHWWPRTAVYFGWGFSTPRFLVEATSPDGALKLSKALGLKDPKMLREVINNAIASLGKGMRQTNMFAGVLPSFDVKTIAAI